MALSYQSIVDAARATATAIEADPDRAERIMSAAGVSLGMLVVVSIALLMGLA